MEIFISELFSYIFGRFDTSGYILPLLVPEIEGGYPERDGGEEEEEGQDWRNSMSLISFKFNFFLVVSFQLIFLNYKNTFIFDLWT